MKLELEPLVRTAPILAANLVAMVGVLLLGWPALKLYELFVLEGLVVILMDIWRAADVKVGTAVKHIDIVLRAVFFAAILSCLLLAVLVAANAKLGGTLGRSFETGNLASDLWHLWRSLGLGIPLAIVASIHAFALARERAIDRAQGLAPVTGRSVTSVTTVLLLAILGIGIVSVMEGDMRWPLAVLVAIKTALDVRFTNYFSRRPVKSLLGNGPPAWTIADFVPTITRKNLTRALPVILANLVPAIGVAAFGWSLLDLLLIYLAETWFIVVMDALRVLFAQRGRLLQGMGEAFGVMLMGSIFVAFFVYAVIMMVGGKAFDGLDKTGNIPWDLLRFIGSLQLAVPLAVIALIHLATTVGELVSYRSGRRKDLPFGRPVLRFFVMIGVFFGMSAVVPITFHGGVPPAWALVPMMSIKLALDIWMNDGQIEHEAWVARVERERAEYQASLDPRGRGSWPKPPVKPP